MIRIGNNEYRLCGLDTNILSEVSKYPDRFLRSILRSLSPAGHILCFSPYSLFELRRQEEVYSAFLDLFDVYPCAMLKNEEQLFEAEHQAYPVPDSVQPIAVGFSALNRGRGLNLKNLLGVVFEREETVKRELEWPTLQKELLADWLALKPNFPPRGKTYLLTDASRFAREATRQHIVFRTPEWCNSLRIQGKAPKISAFPSVQMTLLSVFFRLYEPRGREPVPQDVFDVLISTPSPYLDVVITEAMQASILNKARKILSAIRDLEVYTIRDLRGSACCLTPDHQPLR